MADYIDTDGQALASTAADDEDAQAEAFEARRRLCHCASSAQAGPYLSMLTAQETRFCAKMQHCLLLRKS